MQHATDAIRSTLLAAALSLAPHAGAQIAPPPEPFTFRGADASGHTFYGSNQSGADCETLIPGEPYGYVPSMCWGPRSMWRKGEEVCASHFAHTPGLSPIDFLREAAGEIPGDPDSWWGTGLEGLRGLRMNINLEIGAAPPTMPPRSFDPHADGSPLVPPDGGLAGRPVIRWGRPMLGDTVDLVTGIPMVMETDLELPFGSAVYRHTRTYSEMAPGRHEDACYDASLNQPVVTGGPSGIHSTSVAGHFFDWHGQGWMIGEAPLFLIDAHYQHVVYNGDPTPRRCYFVVNAHQSIPFDFDASNGQYVAPPHLDAYLEHDAVWADGDWNDGPPTEYRVWLYDKTVCYTIRPIFEDVFPGVIPPEGYDASWTNHPHDEDRELLNGDPWPLTDHDSPVSSPNDPTNYHIGANGVPYWGVVERIDDRYGNCIDLHYCEFHPYAAGITQDAFDKQVSGDTCHACAQPCNEKGQLTSARLIANAQFDPTAAGTEPLDVQTDPTNVEWTLLYTYRSFPQYVFGPNGAYDALGTAYPFHQQTAIHTIHVYEHDLDAAEHVCRTIPFSEFVDADGDGPPPVGDTILDAIDEINPTTEAGDRAVPDSWAYELRYMYTEPDPRLDSQDDDPLLESVDWYQNAYGFSCPLPGGSPRLIKATTTTRHLLEGEGGAPDEEEYEREYSLYRWGAHGHTADRFETSPGTTIDDARLSSRLLYSDLVTLQAIYSHADVEEVLAELRDIDPAPWTVNMLVLGENPNSGIFDACPGADLDSLDFVSGACSDDPQRSYTDLASTLLLRWNRVASGEMGTLGGDPIQDYGYSDDFVQVQGDPALFGEDLMANFVLTSDGEGNDIGDFPNRYKYKHIVPGVHIVRGADTANPADQRVYRIYRFLYYEHIDDAWSGSNHVCWSWFDDGGVTGQSFYPPRRSVYHQPYRDDPRFDQLETIDPIYESDLSRTVWVTVVDEYSELRDAKLQPQDSTNPQQFRKWYGSSDSYLQLPERRRVITMNAAGWVLSEDVWDFGDDGTDFARTGAREEFIYDSEGRLSQHKTLAWGTAENVGTRQDHGLIYVYEYPPDIDDEPRFEIARKGMKLGESGDTIWTEEHTYLQERPELPSQSVYHALHGDDALSYITEHDYEFVPNEGPWEDRLLRRKTTLGPVMEVGFGTAAGQYRPQQTELYRTDEWPKGVLEWRCYGLEPVGGDARYATRYFDYTHYDYGGRVNRQIVDCAAGGPLGKVADWRHGGQGNYEDPVDGAVPSYPGWVLPQGINMEGGRVPDPLDLINPALHHTTKLVNRSWGVWIHERARGPYPPDPEDQLTIQKRTFIPRKVEGGMEQRVAELIGHDGEPQVISRGQVTRFGGDRPTEIKQVLWELDPGDYPPTASFSELVDIDIETDAAGRPSKVEATGWDGQTVSAEGSTDHFGGFTRERQPDGTITRTYRDPYGRAVRTYTGVQDQDGFWGYSPPGPDDLILTEQRRYGAGRTDIHQPVMTRHFRERPTGQYAESDWPGEGWVEWHGYDNRLREVWNRIVVPGTEVYDADGRIVGGDSLRTRVTVFDHLDRVMVVAEYGADAPGPPDAYGNLSINGVSLNGLPDASVNGDHTPGLDALVNLFLADPHAPLSLSATEYNDAGLVLEQRQYELDPGDQQVGYLATTTHYDGKGRPILQAAPNTAPVINNYDAMGRLVARRVVKNLVDDPPFEIQRTETEYSAEGNALVVRTFERLHDDAGTDPDLTLGNQNCVVTTVWNWYDEEGRLIATADFGAGNAADQFESTWTVPVYDAATSLNPPTVNAEGDVDRENAGIPNWAVLTCYLYNAAGQKWIEARQIAYDPAQQDPHTYRIDTFQYDGLGNLVFWTENATAPQPLQSSEIRHTAYQYEHGRLVRIAAVLPGHDLTFIGATGGSGQGIGFYEPDWEATDGTLQVTFVDYEGPDLAPGDPLANGDLGLGARVWTGDGTWSHNKSWPAAVYFPNKTTGQPDFGPGPDLEFTYYADGLVRSRTDRLGREFIHHYDERSQRIRTEILYPAGLFPDVGGTDYTPADLADLLLYTYDEHGRLEYATAGQDLNGDDTLDETNDLIITQNLYGYDAKGGLAREYQAYGEPVDTDPNDGDGLSPAIEYARDYSDAAADNYHRLTGMTYPARVQSAEQRIVALSYLGDIDDALSRVTRISDSTGVDADRAVDFAHAGSSRRVARSWSVNDGGALGEVFAQTFDTGATDGYAGLDRHGRTADLAFLRSGESEPFHQYEYGYDAAGNRLFARVLQQSQDNTRSWLYAYDDLGRLASAEHGQLNAAGDGIDQSQGVPSSRVAWGLDRLGNWTEAADGYEGRVEHEDLDGSAGYEALVLAQDHAADLRNELTGIDTDDGTGPVSTPHVHDAAGNLVADGVYYYQYDAFNRIAAVYELNDLTFDAAGIPNGGEPGDWRAKYAYDALGRRVCKQVPWHTGDARMAWYYYDGVRRVQEVFRDPLPPGSLAGNPNPIGSYTTYTDREYVWGPGYVDECLWQIDRTGAAAFVLQDANFNVVALIDETGQVLQQFDYDPYGEVLALDELAAYADNRIGFQGLFADRHDTDAPNPEIAVGAVQTYYARNRDYRPDLGRWMQRDPNGTAAAFPGLWSTGDSPYFALSIASTEALHADGLNLYGMLGHNPVVRTDPRGLFFGGLVGVAANGLFQGLDFIDALEEIRFGIQTSLETRASIDSYAYNQEADVEWALSWDRSDFEFSQGGSTAALALGARLARQKGLQTHHIATNSNTSHGQRFRDLFASADLDLEIPENKVKIPHGGRHPVEYHEYVFERLEHAVEGKKSPSARAKAIKRELTRIGEFLEKHPEFIYDTVQRHSTGSRGTRRRFR